MLEKTKQVLDVLAEHELFEKHQGFAVSGGR